MLLLNNAYLVSQVQHHIRLGMGPVGCEDPGTPHNGRRIGDDFRLGATVYYECDDNFQLVGPGSRVCQDSGLWDGFLPTCSPVSGLKRAGRKDYY